jgi:hypothetical protein
LAQGEYVSVYCAASSGHVSVGALHLLFVQFWPVAHVHFLPHTDVLHSFSAHFAVHSVRTPGIKGIAIQTPNTSIEIIIIADFVTIVNSFHCFILFNTKQKN